MPDPQRWLSTAPDPPRWLSAAPDPPRWLSAIDDPLLRARFLDTWLGIVDVVDIEHAYERAVATRPTAIVVDDSHPGTAALCASMRRANPATRIVVLTTGNREGAWRSLCAGALSVLDARTDSRSLLDALVAASRGEALLDASTAAMIRAHFMLLQASHGDPFVNIARLTFVEESVLAALAAGSSIDAIAASRKVNARAISLQLGFAVRRLHQHTVVSMQPDLVEAVSARRTTINVGSLDTSR